MYVKETFEIDGWLFIIGNIISHNNTRMNKPVQACLMAGIYN